MCVEKNLVSWYLSYKSCWNNFFCAEQHFRCRCVVVHIMLFFFVILKQYIIIHQWLKILTEVSNHSLPLLNFLRISFFLLLGQSFFLMSSPNDSGDSAPTHNQPVVIYCKWLLLSSRRRGLSQCVWCAEPRGRKLHHQVASFCCGRWGKYVHVKRNSDWGKRNSTNGVTSHLWLFVESATKWSKLE